jgi:hypothetical protein
MKKYPETPKVSEMQISLSDFLKSYNQNIPTTYPHASTALLIRFKEAHSVLFKHGDLWSLDLHRKKLMDWLPRNSNVA